MKDKDDVLIKMLRDRLKDYEQPVGDDIWTSIEKELAEKSGRSPVSMWWRCAGIAASLLILLGIGLFFYQYQTLRKDQLAVNQEIVGVQKRADSERIIPERNRNDIEKKVHEERLSSVDKENKVEDVQVKYLIEKENQVAAENKTKREEEKKVAAEVRSEEKPVKEKEVTSQQKEAKQPFLSDASEPDLWKYPKSKKEKKKGISYALALGGNSVPNQEETSVIETRVAYSESKLVGNSNEFIFLTAAPGKKAVVPNDYHYDRPVSVGFSVRKQISNAFAIESGLVYTRLSSKETPQAPTSYIAKDIDLNYLGIPLRAVYSFYENNRLTIYVSGGGMAEKSIYGKETTVNNNHQEKTNRINISELQWSLSGSVGVNYRLIDHLGLFIEPGVGYYFDDESEVMTIRKDSPFNLTLQVGIRLTY